MPAPELRIRDEQQFRIRRDQHLTDLPPACLGRTMVKTAGPTPRFIIDNWAAWSSDLETEEEWDLFFGSQAKIADEQHAKKADVEFLPAMQRRHQSDLKHDRERRRSFAIGL